MTARTQLSCVKQFMPDIIPKIPFPWHFDQTPASGTINQDLFRNSLLEIVYSIATNRKGFLAFPIFKFLFYSFYSIKYLPN